MAVIFCCSRTIDELGKVSDVINGFSLIGIILFTRSTPAPTPFLQIPTPRNDLGRELGDVTSDTAALHPTDFINKLI